MSGQPGSCPVLHLVVPLTDNLPVLPSVINIRDQTATLRASFLHQLQTFSTVELRSGQVRSHLVILFADEFVHEGEVCSLELVPTHGTLGHNTMSSSVTSSHLTFMQFLWKYFPLDSRQSPITTLEQIPHTLSESWLEHLEQTNLSSTVIILPWMTA